MDWTKEEVTLLIKNYPFKPIQEVQQLLPKHTKRAIYKRACEIDLGKKARHIPNKRFSDETIKKAWKSYKKGEKSIPEIARELKTCFSTIQWRFISMFGESAVHRIAKKHNSYFSKRWRWTPTEKELRDIFERYKRSRLHLEEFVKKNLYWKISRKRLSKLFREHFPGEYERHIEEKLHRAYKRGLNFEYQVRDYLKERGYFVLRSPRSYGLADLVAIKKGDIKLIQCKIRGAMLQSKQKKLVRLANSIGAEAVLASRDKGKIKFRRLNIYA